MSETDSPVEVLEPLETTCTSTDCENGLHCFLWTKKTAPADRGRCRECGADLVDWERVHARNLGDAAHTFVALRNETFRHHFWHVPLDPKAVSHARRKGLSGMRAAATTRIRKSVGPAKPYRDGFQTPREGSGNAIYYAQHATATCCRRCIEVWHGIPQGRELGPDEIAYLADLVVLYLAERLPDLPEQDEHVSPRRR